MHERSIASGIIEEAARHGKVTGVTVVVGDLAHLPADEMEAVLKEMTHWNVVVEKAPAEVRCGCGFHGAPEIVKHTHDYTFFKCPKCGEVPEEVLAGKDIILKDVDVE